MAKRIPAHVVGDHTSAAFSPYRELLQQKGAEILVYGDEFDVVAAQRERGAVLPRA